MKGPALLVGPLLWLLSASAGVLAEPTPTGPVMFSTPTSMSTTMPTPTSPAVPTGVEYLLTLGPYGALVWGAYLLGRGLRLTICVELSEKDRELLAGGREPRREP